MKILEILNTRNDNEEKKNHIVFIRIIRKKRDSFICKQEKNNFFQIKKERQERRCNDELS